jgi:hypothetical protein
MTSASSLAFPGSRTLAGWWRQLSPYHATAIAVGHLFFHRLEAPVAVSRLKNIDRLSRLLLEALELETGRSATEQELLMRLQARAHLDRTILHQMLRRLQEERLVGAAFAPTELGRHALRFGHNAVEMAERRAFHFLERWDTEGKRTQPPQFLHLRAFRGTSWYVNDAYPFDPTLLRQCLAQPEEWKQTWGFPADVVRMPEWPSASSEALAWEQVIVDHPEQALAVLIVAPGAAGSRLLGFAARQEGWQLQTAEPLLAIDSGWEGLFPELITPTPEVLAGVWRSWAQAHGVPETEMRVLGLAGHRFQVQAPASAASRLRAVKGETWMLLGEGYVRPALQLEFQSTL